MNEVLARLHIRAISQVFIAAILLALATHSVEKTRGVGGMVAEDGEGEHYNTSFAGRALCWRLFIA